MSKKLKILEKLLIVKDEVKELRYKAIITEAKNKKLPVDGNYTRILRLLGKIIDNQIEQINK